MTVIEPDLQILANPGLLIGDRTVTDTAGGVHEHTYAASGQKTVDVPLAGASDVNHAVDCARAALPDWRATPADTRRDLLNGLSRLIMERGQDLAMSNVVDTSAPLMMSAFQVGLTADLFSYNAGWADKQIGEVIQTWPSSALDYSLQEPYGVVGIIIPWNGPLTSMGQTVAPALAAGNTVVVKPAELAPFGPLALGQLFLDAGFPPGVVNIVPGGAEAGDALVRHPGVDKIHFTGSGATAAKIMAAASASTKPLGLELGGKSAILIFDDADVDAAIGTALSGAVALSGQGCILPTRVLVHRSIYADVLAGISAAAAGIVVGDPLDLATDMGPVIDRVAYARINGLIRAARDNKDGRVIAGDEELDPALSGGYFIRPTIFADVENSTSLAQNEVFGPVQSVIPFDTEAEAVFIANDTRYGLAGYVFTNDLKRAHRVAHALEAGSIQVNGFAGVPAAAPFGGVKQSGFGRLGGIDGIREFSRPKNIWIAM